MHRMQKTHSGGTGTCNAHRSPGPGGLGGPTTPKDSHWPLFVYVLLPGTKREACGGWWGGGPPRHVDVYVRVRASRFVTV